MIEIRAVVTQAVRRGLGSFLGAGGVPHLDLGGGYMGVCLSPSASSCPRRSVYFTVYEIHLNRKDRYQKRNGSRLGRAAPETESGVGQRGEQESRVGQRGERGTTRTELEG